MSRASRFLRRVRQYIAEHDPASIKVDVFVEGVYCSRCFRNDRGHDGLCVDCLRELGPKKPGRPAKPITREMIRAAVLYGKPEAVAEAGGVSTRHVRKLLKSPDASVEHILLKEAMCLNVITSVRKAMLVAVGDHEVDDVVLNGREHELRLERLRRHVK